MFLFTDWVDKCQSAIVYERRAQSQILYAITVSSILGRLPLVPVKETGTIPFKMRRESADFQVPGAARTVIKPRTVVAVVDGGT